VSADENNPIGEVLRKKGMILNAWFKAEGLKDLGSVRAWEYRSRKTCTWCDKFRDADFYTCFNCGRRLKYPGQRAVEV